MRCLLNSAVLGEGAYGAYKYEPATVADLVALVRGEYVSRVGYRETAELIASLTGVLPSLSRETSALAPGDDAVVVRLRYRLRDPQTKGQIRALTLDDVEIARIVRL